MVRADDETFLRNAYVVRELFGDKWTPAVLIALADGPRRRSEILLTVNELAAGVWPDGSVILHDSILARTLKKLTEDRLVERRPESDPFPPKVFYALTDATLDYLALERGVAGWAGRHPTAIRASARRHRAIRVPDIPAADSDDCAGTVGNRPAAAA